MRFKCQDANFFHVIMQLLATDRLGEALLRLGVAVGCAGRRRGAALRFVNLASMALVPNTCTVSVVGVRLVLAEGDRGAAVKVQAIRGVRVPGLLVAQSCLGEAARSSRSLGRGEGSGEASSLLLRALAAALDLLRTFDCGFASAIPIVAFIGQAGAESLQAGERGSSAGVQGCWGG
jgi:hypothetical protein